MRNGRQTLLCFMFVSAVLGLPVSFSERGIETIVTGWQRASWPLAVFDNFLTKAHRCKAMRQSVFTAACSLTSV